LYALDYVINAAELATSAAADALAEEIFEKAA
jgi:hypothetical protein